MHLFGCVCENWMEFQGYGLQFCCSLYFWSFAEEAEGTQIRWSEQGQKNPGRAVDCSFPIPILASCWQVCHIFQQRNMCWSIKTKSILFFFFSSCSKDMNILLLLWPHQIWRGLVSTYHYSTVYKAMTMNEVFFGGLFFWLITYIPPNHERNRISN